MSKGLDKNLGKRVGCPFYLGLSEKKNEIKCEGIMSGSKIKQTFQSKRDLEDHVKVNCTGGCYRQCPLYRALKEMRYKMRD